MQVLSYGTKRLLAEKSQLKFQVAEGMQEQIQQSFPFQILLDIEHPKYYLIILPFPKSLEEYTLAALQTDAQNHI